MQNRTPFPRSERQLDLAFAPVPRRSTRHDGWTPERQKAFIEALADTGSVRTACRMVNMSSYGAYFLRRQPGAEAFRRAWEAALDFGVQRLKDEAFERAMNGQLVPVFAGGNLMGFRRKKNDRLLMFCLRHYGQDSHGRRVTINYFANRGAAPLPSAGEGLGRGEGTALTQSSATLRAIAPPAPHPDEDALAATLGAFEGVALDQEAQAEILRVLASCAERRRASELGDDPDTPFVQAGDAPSRFMGELEFPGSSADFEPFREGELPWQGMGEDGENQRIERVLAEMAEPPALPAPKKSAKPRKPKRAEPKQQTRSVTRP
jgi:hypothetical protein